MAGKLRYLFWLDCGHISLPGQIYSGSNTFWNFAGKFSWEVGDTLPPFRLTHHGKDVSSLIFFGVPQALVRILYGELPQNAERFQIDTNRNCANCEYLQFASQEWEAFKSRPTSERFERFPKSLFSCAISGEPVDFLPPTARAGSELQALRTSTMENSCSAHTRKAYKQELSPQVRTGSQTWRWVPAEYRRLRALNPKSILIDQETITLPGGITIPYGPV